MMKVRAVRDISGVVEIDNFYISYKIEKDEIGIL